MDSVIFGFCFEKKHFVIWKRLFQLATFKDFYIIFCANEIWEINFSQIKSFVLPSLFFYFPFSLHSNQAVFNKFFKIAYHVSYIYSKKGVKKLVRGVKNFWFVKYLFSAFFCTKNYVKSFKTHENVFSWK